MTASWGQSSTFNPRWAAGPNLITICTHPDALIAEKTEPRFAVGNELAGLMYWWERRGLMAIY